VFDEDGHTITQIFRQNQAPTFELLGDCLSDDALTIIFGLLHGKKFEGLVHILAFGTSGVFVATFVLYLGYGLIFLLPTAVNEPDERSASFLKWCCVGPLTVTCVAATILLVPFVYLFFDDLGSSPILDPVLHLAGVALVFATMWAFMARGAMEYSFAMKEEEEADSSSYRALESK